MRTIKTILVFTVVAALGLLTAACPQQTSVADIQAQPGRYQSKEVGIVGRVTDSYGVSVPGIQTGGIYKIDDGTGSIWVAVVGNSVPLKGDRIAVKGTVSTGVSWAGKNYGLGVRETGRRYPGGR